MKKVISGKELKEKMLESVNLICDAVGSTLGPSGNNVLINTDDSSSYITNDGVTIATSISSEDIIVDTILDIIKEASLKTDEKVGDGTTTTLVLLKQIFQNGLKEIYKGINAVYLKKEIEASVKEVIKEIELLKNMPTKEDLKSIASISSEDYKIGNVVSEVYDKVGSKSAIRIEEGDCEETFYNIKSGYSVETEISTLYFKNNENIKLNNPYIVTIRGYLESLEQVSSIINEGLENNRNIVIFSEDFDESVKNEIMIYYLQAKKNVFLFKVPDYAKRQDIILEDISAISNSKIVNLNYNKIIFNDLGRINTAYIKENEVILMSDNKIEDRLIKLEKELKKTDSDYDKEFINDEIAKLTKGIATIYVGGITKIEKKEKIMRCYDAINAIEESKKGIVVGEGIIYLKVRETLSSNSIGDEIIKKALLMPFMIIMQNSGVTFNVFDEIKSSKYKKAYNIQNETFEDIKYSNIIDPESVVKEALINAASIATMLLTTNYLVINTNEDTMRI